MNYTLDVQRRKLAEGYAEKFGVSLDSAELAVDIMIDSLVAELRSRVTYVDHSNIYQWALELCA